MSSPLDQRSLNPWLKDIEDFLTKPVNDRIKALVSATKEQVLLLSYGSGKMVSEDISPFISQRARRLIVAYQQLEATTMNSELYTPGSNDRLLFDTLDLADEWKVETFREKWGSFKMIISFYSNEWSKDNVTLVKNMRKLLKPDGFVYTVLMCNSPLYRMYTEVAKVPTFSQYMQNHLDYIPAINNAEHQLAALESVFKNNGFLIVNLTTQKRHCMLRSADEVRDFVDYHTKTFRDNIANAEQHGQFLQKCTDILLSQVVETPDGKDLSYDTHTIFVQNTDSADDSEPSQSSGAPSQSGDSETISSASGSFEAFVSSASSRAPTESSSSVSIHEESLDEPPKSPVPAVEPSVPLVPQAEPPSGQSTSTDSPHGAPTSGGGPSFGGPSAAERLLQQELASIEREFWRKYNSGELSSGSSSLSSSTPSSVLTSSEDSMGLSMSTGSGEQKGSSSSLELVSPLNSLELGSSTPSSGELLSSEEPLPPPGEEELAPEPQRTEPLAPQISVEQMEIQVGESTERSASAKPEPSTLIVGLLQPSPSSELSERSASASTSTPSTSEASRQLLSPPRVRSSATPQVRSPSKRSAPRDAVKDDEDDDKDCTSLKLRKKE